MTYIDNAVHIFSPNGQSLSATVKPIAGSSPLRVCGSLQCHLNSFGFFTLVVTVRIACHNLISEDQSRLTRLKTREKSPKGACVGDIYISFFQYATVVDFIFHLSRNTGPVESLSPLALETSARSIYIRCVRSVYTVSKHIIYCQYFVMYITKCTHLERQTDRDRDRSYNVLSARVSNPNGNTESTDLYQIQGQPNPLWLHTPKGFIRAGYSCTLEDMYKCTNKYTQKTKVYSRWAKVLLIMMLCVYVRY